MQYYCHLNAFAMGVALGVDGIIMPHAKRRRKYTAQATVWEETRADTLWNVGAVRRYAAGVAALNHKLRCNSKALGCEPQTCLNCDNHTASSALTS